MDVIAITGVHLTDLPIFSGDPGEVLRVLRATEEDFLGFGEAYFSTVHKDKIKGWKKHREVTLNLVVPCGEVQFVLYDDRIGGTSFGRVNEFVLSPTFYKRLTVPPGIWVAFQGREHQNIVLNVANGIHNPNEIESLPVNTERVPYRGWI
jgi:dTDP-4-dehydrorhamnose 3,5-epimerase